MGKTTIYLITEKSKTMKILLIANYILSNQQSMQHYARLLSEGLAKSGYNVRVIYPKTFSVKGSQAEHGLNKWLGYCDRFLFFRRQLREAMIWADIVHICDHSNSMYSNWIDKPVVITCHDVMAIKSAKGLIENNKVGFTGKIFQKWIEAGLKNCSHIFCVSNKTQEELTKTIAIPIERTTVINNALNYSYSPMCKEEAFELIQRKCKNLNPDFFFHLGGNQWYKNRKGVVEIYEKLIKHSEFKDHQLVLAGKGWPKGLRDKIKSLKIEDKVIEVNNLKNEEIRAFYSASTALIFPSLEEGFGWPLAEAQACGCIVATNGIAPMTEVGGKAAIYFDPSQPTEAAEIIKKKLSDHVSLKNMGLENAKRFSTEKMIASYITGYKKILMDGSEKQQ